MIARIDDPLPSPKKPSRRRELHIQATEALDICSHFLSFHLVRHQLVAVQQQLLDHAEFEKEPVTDEESVQARRRVWAILAHWSADELYGRPIKS